VDLRTDPDLQQLLIVFTTPSGCRCVVSFVAD
jgi:hypothetical protein